MLRVAAVDLGATSARVAVVDLDDPERPVEVVHRYAHKPAPDADGHLRWDWTGLVAEVERGLARALDDGPLASIGVDAWGVDYGLIDASGALVAAPYSYRDHRTDNWHKVADRLGRDRLYTATGLQLMGINTVFQLAVHDRAELDRAATLLMIPELLVHQLTGAVTGEVTSAGTSGLVDVHTGEWSTALIDDLGLSRSLFPTIARATAAVGAWHGIPVYLVGGHDTASAVAARPPDAPDASAFVATGTWFLVGAERAAPDVSDAARAANFSNEAGALGGTRFLKNVTGLWLLERCRAKWGDPPLEPLVAAAAACPPGGPVIDPNDPAFANPTDMPGAIAAAAGWDASVDRGRMVRCIFDSIAARTAAVVDELSGFLGGQVARLDLLGGATQSAFLCQLVAEATGIEVVVGAAEATALGNALVQGVALGRFADLPAARRSSARVR